MKFLRFLHRFSTLFWYYGVADWTNRSNTTTREVTQDE
jgi:hypothetical protein